MPLLAHAAKGPERARNRQGIKESHLLNPNNLQENLKVYQMASKPARIPIA